MELSFELTSLASAKNYQEWVYRTVEPFLGKRILECGSGIGNMSQWLPARERLVLSETDPELIQEMRKRLAPKLADPRVEIREMKLPLQDLSSWKAEKFDTIVTFNVLEHIEDDGAAMKGLVSLLADQGVRRMVHFVPAHPWAYGEMDKSFGHYRRYTKTRLREICQQADPRARVSIRHFNVLGLPGWWLQGRVMGKKQIGMGSIQAFEKICRYFAPVDDFIHRNLRVPFGQSLLCVMEWDA